MEKRQSNDFGCCKVESLMSVDERGQMVLPKDIRERAGIEPGDKLALITWGKDDAILVISLLKSSALTDTLKNVLGQMIKEFLR